MRGQQGRIKVGYQSAATLGRFSLTPSAPNVWTVEASVTSTDAFWLTQKPHTLELTIGKQRWSWAKADLEIGGGVVRGTVTGRPERR